MATVAPNPPAPAPMLSVGDTITVSRGFAELSVGAKIGLMAGAAALVAVLVAAVLWARTPDYRVLFSNLNDRDGGAIVTALGQMNVPYKFAEGGGAILVPANSVHDVRLKLASQGLPKGGSVGFELLESQKFGATQFQEQVNYQRALEGELARSIQSLGQVQNARVHLAIPKPSVFLRDQQKPTASVLVTLHPAKALDRNQIAGIVHLVASSVPELAPKSVSIVDQNGNLLSSNTDQNNALDPSQLAYVREIESQLVKRVGEILEPILGRANFRAQVTADIDFTQTESTDERYKPNTNPADATIRSTQTADAASTGAGGPAQGVPGALTNQPPTPTVAPIQGAAGRPGAQGADPVRNPSATQRNAVTNYEVDKTIRHTRGQTGSIKRLSGAIVINFRKAEGAEKPAPIEAAELDNLTALVREAIGFREDRGDTIKVTSAAFNPEVVETPPEVPFWKNPEMVHWGMDIGKYLFVIALFAYLVLGVLKPTMRQLATPRITLQSGPSQPVAPVQVAEQPADAEDDDDDLMPLPNQTSDPRAIARALRGPDKQINAREIAKADPKLVANVVRTWVTKDG